MPRSQRRRTTTAAPPARTRPLRTTTTTGRKSPRRLRGTPSHLPRQLHTRELRLLPEPRERRTHPPGNGHEDRSPRLRPLHSTPHPGPANSGTRWAKTAPSPTSRSTRPPPRHPRQDQHLDAGSPRGLPITPRRHHLATPRHPPPPRTVGAGVARACRASAVTVKPVRSSGTSRSAKLVISSFVLSTYRSPRTPRSTTTPIADARTPNRSSPSSTATCGTDGSSPSASRPRAWSCLASRWPRTPAAPPATEKTPLTPKTRRTTGTSRADPRSSAPGPPHPLPCPGPPFGVAQEPVGLR